MVEMSCHTSWGGLGIHNKEGVIMLDVHPWELTVTYKDIYIFKKKSYSSSNQQI